MGSSRRRPLDSLIWRLSTGPEKWAKSSSRPDGLSPGPAVFRTCCLVLHFTVLHFPSVRLIWWHHVSTSHAIYPTIRRRVSAPLRPRRIVKLTIALILDTDLHTPTDLSSYEPKLILTLILCDLTLNDEVQALC